MTKTTIDLPRLRRALHDIIIFHEDDDIVVVYKPALVLSIPDHFDPTLPNMLDYLRRRTPEIYPVHRLDKETSGVMLFAKNADAHRNLNEQFESRTIHKRYLGLVEGNPVELSGVIDLPLSERESRPGMITIDHRYGKSAITRYTVLEQLQSAAMLEFFPETGRQHQIRAHCKAIGHPLLIDALYGNHPAVYLSQMKHSYKLTEEIERPTMDRLTLHSSSITFAHPTTTETSTYSAELPKDFETLLRHLHKYGAIHWNRRPQHTNDIRRFNKKSDLSIFFTEESQ